MYLSYAEHTGFERRLSIMAEAALRSDLTEDDLGEVLEQVFPASSKWYNIGLGLRVKTSSLERIKARYDDPADCLREAIKEWLQTSCSPLTWSNVSDALRKQVVRQDSLANKIEKLYCHTEEDVENASTASDVEIPSEGHVVTSSMEPKVSGTDDDQPRSKLGHGSHESQFPFLQLKGLSLTEEVQLGANLHDAYKKIDLRFAKFVTNICDSLVERRIEPSKLAEMLRTVTVFESLRKGSELSVLHDCYEDIKKANTINAIFDIIRDFISFFDYGLLEYIVSQLGSDEDHAHLQQYKEYLDEYCKRSVYECPSLSKIKNGCSKLVAKIDKGIDEIYSMEKMKRLIEQFVKIIEVSESALKLCEVKPGCVELHFQMPRFVRELIFPFSEDTKASLRRIGVIHLTCDNDQYLTSSPAKRGAQPRSNQRPIPPQAAKQIFVRPRGFRGVPKECIRYKLLGYCDFGDQCTYKHGEIVRRKSIGKLPYPTRLPWKLVIGRIGNNPNRAYITQISEEDPDKEVIVIAENEKALEEAKKDLTILFAQLFPMRPGWTFLHNDAIVTPDLRVMFQECKGRVPWHHQKRTAFEIVTWQEAGTSEAATLQEIGEMRSTVYPQADTVARVLQTVDEEGQMISNVRTDTTANARFKMMTDRKQIVEDLTGAFRWLDKPENKKPFYTSKLEARFGKLAFSNLPKGLIAPGVSISVKEFAEFVFKDTTYKQIFNTEVKNESALQLRAGLGGPFSMLETYDMKLVAKNKGHLDVRIAFEHGKPRVLQLKKDEHKVVVFDFLCLHRNHDMRLSLSRFEVLRTSPLDAITSSLLSHVSLNANGDLQLVPHTRVWTVSYIRHKKREAFHLTSNSVMSISEIEEFQIKKTDMEFDQLLVMKSRYNKKHFEVEFHNLAWVTAFGRQIGLSPQRSLSPLLEERAIRELPLPEPGADEPCSATEMIIRDFEKEGIFEMIESINVDLGRITT